MVQKTVGWDYDEKKDRVIQKRITIGYTSTRKEALQMLAEYNLNPFEAGANKITFAEIYERWAKEHLENLSKASKSAYEVSYKECVILYDKPFRSLKTSDFQRVIDSSRKNYPTLRKLKLLLTSMSNYAMKNDIISKDYAHYVNIEKFKNKNPNKIDRNVFSDDEIECLWKNTSNVVIQYTLILIYSGLRIGEFLNLRKEHVDLENKVFKVTESKTDAGIRIVPISDRTLPFFESLMKSDSDFICHLDNGEKMSDWTFRNDYWKPILTELNMDYHRPHDTRHTCTSLMHRAKVDLTTQKKILGHKGKMSLTERVYTHLEHEELLTAINSISI